METSPYPCICGLIRRSGRILTKKYDHYLKPSGLRVTQLRMLTNISRNPGITVSELAELLLMDQSTVTRNLRVLEKIGYIFLEPAISDNRIKRIHVSDAGSSKMDEARPLWEKAQREMVRILGQESIKGLIDSLNKMAG